MLLWVACLALLLLLCSVLCFYAVTGGGYCGEGRHLALEDERPRHRLAEDQARCCLCGGGKCIVCTSVYSLRLLYRLHVY